MGEGERIVSGKINDPRYPEDVWKKMEYGMERPNGKEIVIHYWENILTGGRKGFKFKNK